MHARITTAQIKAGKMEDTLAIWRDSVAPIAKEQKGFTGAFVLIDRATDKAMSIALWQTEDDMEALEISGLYHEILAKFGDVLDGPPTREYYEVGLTVTGSRASS